MISEIQERIRKQCHELGRDEPELIAVSKRQPNLKVKAVLDGGFRIFGENQVQEAAGKWPEFRIQFPDIQLHLLGPLQSNKVNAALELFDVIHSLDRLKLAKRLANAGQSMGRFPEMFIQVNIGSESQKSGVLAEDFDAFLSEITPMELRIVGLMCIPPAKADPRPYFRELREMASHHGLKYLSMGMSGDFEIAIEEGATHIRVGSAIFGERAY